MKGKMNE